MDAIDVAILRAMGIRPYERHPKPLDALQPARLARATGLSVNTVKDRLTRLTDSGVIAGYNAVPNLRHLGLQGEAYYFQFANDAQKDAAMSAILGLPGLLELHDYLGRGVCAEVAFQTPEERESRLQALAECSGDVAPRRFYVREMPEVRRALTPLDWRILQALRADPRAGAAELAEPLGVSARTVKRHLARMAAEGSIFLVPIVDPGRAEGLFLFDLLVHLQEGAGPGPMRALREAFREEHVYAYVPSTAELGHFDMLLFARTAAEVETLRRRAEAVPGVARAEAWLFRAFLDTSRWMDEAIAEAAARTIRVAGD